MGFSEAVSSGFRNYVGFSGRACRSEFWYWSLFVFGVSFFFGAVLPALGMGFQWAVLVNLFSLVVLLPNIAVSVRRLHDLDKSGWWVLLWFIPLIGAVVLIIWFVGRGTPGENRFGPDPLNDTLMVTGPDAS